MTAAGVAVAAHLLFGFDWLSAFLIGTALSPTDPAVVFSVLGGREIAGRWNHPGGGIGCERPGWHRPDGDAAGCHRHVRSTCRGWSPVLAGVGTFAPQMTVGAVVGVLGGLGSAR